MCTFPNLFALASIYFYVSHKTYPISHIYVTLRIPQKIFQAVSNFISTIFLAATLSFIFPCYSVFLFLVPYVWQHMPCNIAVE
jgi:hypothetical protein